MAVLASLTVKTAACDLFSMTAQSYGVLRIYLDKLVIVAVTVHRKVRCPCRRETQKRTGGPVYSGSREH